MSSGHYCLIRDLGLVKGGKGLRHHEVVLHFSWRGLVRAAKARLHLNRVADGPLQADEVSSIQATSVAGMKAD